ncbi:hypothetical protein QFC21_006128 [Naganishia friedmannii]|uniref:Uncharacterized protein n=1 Tax=Naganishia friedmannii TaxID=89922 RepID=A0ACC2V3U9_9TREE|nr:hypothetical protein QFC21_006128 [Naganishia friedmannii]
MLLDPTVREEGLKKLLTKEYKADKYFKETIGFLKLRVLDYEHQAEQGGWDAAEKEVVVVEKPQRVNRSPSAKYQSGEADDTLDLKNSWACYTSGRPRYATFTGEPMLVYWKRMLQYQEMWPMAMAARDVLGMASSSASVERLFSHAGHVLDGKRGSLSAKLLAKQTMLPMWDMQGFMTLDDL